jgi:hypothetical protein
VGITVVLPAGATVPIPLLIVADSALFDVQVKVVLNPAVTVVGNAANATVGTGVTGGVAAEDPHPLNKPVAKLKIRNIKNRWTLRSRWLFIAQLRC